MSKLRIMIADTDVNYVNPFQVNIARNFSELFDLEIVTDRQYLKKVLKKSQKIDALVISENLFYKKMKKYNITHIFLMTEHYTEQQAEDPGVVRLFRYANITEIFNEILSRYAGG